MSLMTHIRRLWHRARFYADVPTVLLLLKFRELRKAFYRELWREAAQRSGAEIGDLGSGFSGISRNGMTTAVKLSSVMLDDHLTVQLVNDKAVTSNLLKQLGAPVPAFCAYTMSHLAPAEAFLATLSGNAVVKPAGGTGAGRGVTTGISTPKQLREASRHAARFAGELMIEEEITGHSFRLLYLEGRLIDAVRRDPPALVGDGKSTIRQLIKAENDRRLNDRPFTALSPIRIDNDCLGKLRAQGFTLRSRPAVRQSVVVKQVPNENAARDNHGVLSQVHPEIASLGARLVNAVGVRFAGLDLICKDIARPLTPDNGRINEINATPGIHHHYLVADRSNIVPVASIVLDHLFSRRQGVMFLQADPPALALAG
jgi:cyanophycin synthetase